MARRCLGLKTSLHSFIYRSPCSDRFPLYLPQSFVRTVVTSPYSPPRKFPTFGFVVLDATEKIEEEDVPSYVADDYYPVYIGEVFGSRYQVVTKLGFGVNSTVWLCRDLREHRYLALKMHVRTKKRDLVDLQSDREITINEHLNSNPIEHSGKDIVRRVLDSFEITGPNGNHKCTLYQPLGMRFAKFERSNPPYSPDELEQPIALKILSDRTIYISRPMPLCRGLPVLCDLGEARFGPKHRGDIMPGIYRAPEVILGMEWDSKVDIWAMGVMTWDLLQGTHLFFASKNRMLDDEQHLAEMVSLLGPPPPGFLKRSEKCSQYWDSQGNWKGSIPIPDQSFEIRAHCLHGEDQVLFLQFLRSILSWMPEERPVVEELAYDDFLMQPHGTAFSETSTEKTPT